MYAYSEVLKFCECWIFMNGIWCYFSFFEYLNLWIHRYREICKIQVPQKTNYAISCLYFVAHKDHMIIRGRENTRSTNTRQRRKHINISTKNINNTSTMKCILSFCLAHSAQDKYLNIIFSHFMQHLMR